MRITIVDMSGIFRAAWMAGSDKPVSHAYETTLSRVRSLAPEADRVVVATDVGPSFRHDLSPRYKAHRAKPDAQMVDQMRRAEEALARDGYAVVGVKDYEADDVIATIATQCESCGFDVLIHSADKDLLALVSNHTQVRSTATGRLWTPEAVAADTKATDKNARGWGVRPDQMRDLLALAGDSADGVPGVDGVGAETASKLLRAFGDIGGTVRALDRPDFPAWKGMAKVRESIQAAAHGWPDDGPLSLSVRLVTLRRDVPLDAFGGLDGILAKREPQPQRPDFGKDFPVDEDEYEDEAEEDAPPDDRRRRTEGGPPEVAPTGGASSPAPTGVVQAATPAVAARGDSGAGDSSVSMVVAEPIEWSRMIEPRTPRGAHWLACQMFESRLFAGYGNNGTQSPEACLALIYAGRELGIGAVASLRGLHVIRGKIAMSSMLMVGLCLARAAEFFELEESSPEAATWATKRRDRDREHRVTYTLQQAKAAGLYPGKRGQGNEPTMWERDPENMLVQRAASRLARRVFPDVLMGAAYTREELEETE